MMRVLRCFGIICLCGATSSCALGDKMREIGLLIGKTGVEIQGGHEKFAQAVDDARARRAAQEVDRPWLAGRSTPLAREVVLPLALRADVNTTMIFSGAALNLSEVAQRITAVTSIPVHVRPDALLPMERFLPRLANAAQTGALNQAPTTVVLAGGPEPLARMLDRISARLGIMWRYTNERIEFYRTETRVFNVRALTLDATAEASLGLSAGAGSEGFASASKTVLSSGSRELLTVVRARLEPFLSRAGLLVAEPGAGSLVVVTDTPDVLQRISVYLEQENKILTRRVRLIFEEITLATQDSAEAGLDWNLVFSGARMAAAVAVPGSNLAESASVSVGLNHGSFKDSEAVIRALSQVGKVVRRSSVPVLTLNRRPVTHAVRTTFSYIDKVQTTALGTGVASFLPSVSVSQKDETVGSLLTLVPDAQDDGQILLSVAYDNTVAQPLKSITFGDKDNPLQLQQITIDGNGTVQQVALQPGQPLVISGFDRTQQESETRRLNPGVPMAFGGRDRVSSQHLTTVMVVTAQVEEGF